MTSKPPEFKPPQPNRREFLATAAFAPLAVGIKPSHKRQAVCRLKSAVTGKNSNQLRRIALQGLIELELLEPLLSTSHSFARLEKELSLIEYLGLSGDYLTAYELIHQANESGFLVLGRWVEHCSLVAYVLGIVRLCPITVGLSYEEFADEINRKPRVNLDVCSIQWDSIVEAKSNKLRTLRLIPKVFPSVIHCIQTLIRATRSGTLVGLQAPLNDSATYQMLSLGQTEDIPFLDQPQSQRILTRLRPESFEELVAFSALEYGWFDTLAVWEFIAAKRGQVRFAWPSLIAETLSSTYGQVIFRDQAFRVIQDLLLCDYTSAARYWQEMIDPTSDNYIDRRKTLRDAAGEIGLDDLMTSVLLEQFGRVNSESCSRAISVYGAFHDYTLAYLKTHYPAEYGEAWHQVKDATGITF